MTGAVTRRGFIGAAAAGAAIVSTTGNALAASVSDGGLFLLDLSLDNEAQMAFATRSGGDSLVALQQDVVRQWRDGLGQAVANAGGAIAVVRWAEAHVLAGLARESGGTASIHQLAGNAFEVRIAGEIGFRVSRF